MWGSNVPARPCVWYNGLMNERTDLRPVAEDLEIVTEYLRSIGCSEIYLFGSVAEGDERETSDLDIAVRGIPAKRFFAVYGEVLNRCSRPVDLVDLDLQETLGRQILAGANVKRVA